jgi:hypothetical protein
MPFFNVFGDIGGSAIEKQEVSARDLMDQDECIRAVAYGHR